MTNKTRKGGPVTIEVKITNEQLLKPGKIQQPSRSKKSMTMDWSQ